MLSNPRSNFGQMATITQHELNKFVSSKRMYIFVVLMLAYIIGLTYMGFTSLESDYPPTVEDFTYLYLSFFGIILLVAAIVFSASSLVSEFEDRTALLIFTRPIKKVSIFCGKLFASLIVTCGFVVLFYVALYGVSLALFDSFMPEIYTSLGYALLFAVAITGIAFLMSSIFKRGSIATIMVVMIVLLALPIVNQLLLFRGIDGWFWLGDASMIITQVLGTVYDLITPVVVMFMWSVVTIVCSYLLFSRREF